MNFSRSMVSTSRILLNKCIFLVLVFLKSFVSKLLNFFVTVLILYERLKHFITFTALSVAAEDGSTKYICFMFGTMCFSFRKSSKQIVAVPCPHPQSNISTSSPKTSALCMLLNAISSFALCILPKLCRYILR